MTRQEVIDVLIVSLQQFNDEFAPLNPLLPSEHTQLLPAEGGLDSLGFVNLVAMIEENLEGNLGVLLPLPEQSSNAEGVDPWQCVGTLADLVMSRAGSPQVSE